MYASYPPSAPVIDQDNPWYGEERIERRKEEKRRRVKEREVREKSEERGGKGRKRKSEKERGGPDVGELMYASYPPSAPIIDRDNPWYGKERE
jgi:hypothetical protein